LPRAAGHETGTRRGVCFTPQPDTSGPALLGQRRRLLREKQA